MTLVLRGWFRLLWENVLAPAFLPSTLSQTKNPNHGLALRAHGNMYIYIYIYIYLFTYSDMYIYIYVCLGFRGLRFRDAIDIYKFVSFPKY